MDGVLFSDTALDGIARCGLGSGYLLLRSSSIYVAWNMTY